MFSIIQLRENCGLYTSVACLLNANILLILPTTSSDRYDLSPILDEETESWKGKELASVPQTFTKWGNGCSESRPPVSGSMLRSSIHIFSIHTIFTFSLLPKRPHWSASCHLCQHVRQVWRSKTISCLPTPTGPHDSWIHWPRFHLHPSGDFQICLDLRGLHTSVHQIRLCEMHWKLQTLELTLTVVKGMHTSHAETC